VKKIDFIYFDAGGGHRAAANALKAVVDSQQRATRGEPWQIRLVNLQEVLDSLDVFRKVTGIRLEDIYNTMLAKGWTLGSGLGVQFMHGVIRLYHGATVRLLTQHWIDTKPDLVVSLVPNFNRAMYESLRKALPQVPYVTILTDFADYPPHFWMEAGQAQYFVCGTEKAVEQAHALGHTDDRIFTASGMILRPRFYEPVKVDRAVERARLGLHPTRPTGLVLFGGQGSGVMLEISERLRDTQLILICGRNEKLAARLKGQRADAPRFIEGFTQEVPYYMYLSDFFIGKPGPGSISEAVAMKLPVIVEQPNAFTLPQERYNPTWVRERRAGMVVDNFRGIAGAVKELLASLDSYRESVSRIENRAVFEIPDILATILEKKATL
jgi:UDP-N-acetylglucosamine:LPS N-acetylglucosamine transferase